MAFSDYRSISQVQAEYKIKYQEEIFIVADDYAVPIAFEEDFLFNQQHLDTFSSEAARCEMVIFPVLREIYKVHHQKIALWVQKPMGYDEKLTGTPDYMVSKKSEWGKTFLEYPLLMLVEAKKNDFEQGWGQCLAELIAAQCLNAAPTTPVYGIVTDGKLWEFGKLTGNIFTKNSAGVTIDRLAQLLGTLNFLFQQAIADHIKTTP